ncbi:MAG: phenylalanine--tRNA ligase subunit beta, partial [Planctomycetes bacterium]|nr:phenylalanine--tRNA ligase subunit beta [Planctomycetota bacterium]
YTGLVIEGVPARPGPLWMQLRLGRTGLRPISGLVDLTNYVMTDLGQPMHAFDAAKVTSIEVDWAKEGELIRTLDGMERKLTTKELMIQCGGRSIALAGLMGGLDTEVSEATTALFLESANFDAATIRRTAGRLGLRTDASARFEKSLDPAHTVLAIQRFMHLAKAIYPELTLRSRLSDCYVAPREAITVSVNPRHVARTIGREVTREEASEILQPLGFEVPSSGTDWKVSVPSFRATRDVSIEADVIEELARYIGYGKIAPAMPRVAMRRFAVNALHELEQRTLEHFTTTHRFHEIHGYLWYDAGWLDQLGIDPGPCIELRNPPAVGLHRFRRTLMPGMLAAVVRNRFHFTAFSLIELGSVFEKSGDPSGEFRHVGLVCARRGKRAEGDLVDQLKGAVEVWAWKRFTCPVSFGQATAESDRPWEHPKRTATITIGGVQAGRISVVGPALRRVMDEHLSSWSICWAELRLCDLVKIDHRAEPLGTIPDHPLVEMDFSIVVAATTPYAEVVTKLAEFEHALLKRIRYVGSYEGESLGANRRSLTFRVLVGEDDRTLTESDANAFRGEFETHLRRCDYEIRTG